MPAPPPRQAPPSSEPPAPTEAELLRPLGLVRIALLLGVLMFGAVIWWNSRQAPPAPTTLTPTALRGLVLGLAVVALITMIGVRVMLGRVRGARRRGTLCIVAWAAGEAAALAGGVYYFAFHDPQWYVVGLFVLITSFVVVPLRPAS
ncbi:MAG TPA: hypothetical protein VF041_08635 [Gemmatimonadaceae bacterium]